MHTPRRFHAALLACAALASGEALAMQVLTATDHAEMEAEVSAHTVSRIALADDRIARIVRPPGGFALEHDAVRGDLYVRPLGPETPETATLFLGTERGFTYRLTLTLAERDAAQVLIRNPDAAEDADTDTPAPGDARIAALVALVRAVAARTPPAGVAVEGATGERHAGLRVLETWRARHLTARVLALGSDFPTDAAALGRRMGADVAAVWVPEGSARHAVVVEAGR